MQKRERKKKKKANENVKSNVDGEECFAARVYEHFSDQLEAKPKGQHHHKLSAAKPVSL